MKDKPCEIYLTGIAMKNGKEVGYNFIDAGAVTMKTSTIKKITVPLQSAITAASAPDTAQKFVNVAVVNNKIEGTNGALSRYAHFDIDTGAFCDSTGKASAVEKSPLVVLRRITLDGVKASGYIVSDYAGNILRMKNDTAIEYSKLYGIANGKIVTQNGIDYLSSISGTYPDIKINVREGKNTGVGGLAISTNHATTVTAKMGEDLASANLEYEDKFDSLTKAQKLVIKQYYIWYTVNVYEKLANGTSLIPNATTAAKLAQIKGGKNWEFSGINDSYLEENFDAHCEMGHKLRYEFIAIPENIKAKVHELRQQFNMDILLDNAPEDYNIRDMGAIVFGRTCTAEFFQISKEQVDDLTDTQNMMTEEMKRTVNIIANNLQERYKNACSFLLEAVNIITKNDLKNNIDALEALVGNNLALSLAQYIQVELPIPQSMVIYFGDKVRENQEKFFKALFPNHEKLLDRIYNQSADELIPIKNIKLILDYVAKYTIEGDYQFDPLNDTEIKIRHGKEYKYNKDTRNEREMLINSVHSATGFKIAHDFKNSTDKVTIELLDKYFTCIEKAANIGKQFADALEDERVQKMFECSIDSINERLNVLIGKTDTDIELDDNTVNRLAILFSSTGFDNRFKHVEALHAYRGISNYFVYARAINEKNKSYSHSYNSLYHNVYRASAEGIVKVYEDAGVMQEGNNFLFNTLKAFKNCVDTTDNVRKNTYVYLYCIGDHISQLESSSDIYMLYSILKKDGHSRIVNWTVEGNITIVLKLSKFDYVELKNKIKNSVKLRANEGTKLEFDHTIYASDLWHYFELKDEVEYKDMLDKLGSVADTIKLIVASQSNYSGTIIGILSRVNAVCVPEFAKAAATSGNADLIMGCLEARIDIEKYLNPDELEKYKVTLVEVQAKQAEQKAIRDQKDAEEAAHRAESDKKAAYVKSRLEEVKRLLSTKRGNGDYSIDIARDIVRRDVSSYTITPRQLDVIERAIKELSGIKADNSNAASTSNTEVNEKHKLADNADASNTVDKLVAAIQNNDTDLINKVNSAVNEKYPGKADNFVFSIAKTIKIKNEYSDKQYKYIACAQDAIQK